MKIQDSVALVTGANRGIGAEFVRQTFSALAAGRPEVLVDDLTRQVKAGLSADSGIYLDFDPRPRSAAAA